jgi:hypothetical protein
VSSLLAMPDLSEIKPRHARKLFTFGLLLVIGTLAYLENFQPYYFLQCDNHFLSFQTMVQAMREFFDHGRFPTWTGYLLLSGPTTSIGTYALTYPFTYLSYAVARFVLHDEFRLFDVFGWVHFLMGYAFCYAFLRSLKISPLCSVAGALSFVLLGYNLIIGRAWYFMIPTVTWLPASLWTLEQSVQQKKFRWFFSCGLIMALFFQGGNIQLFFYGFICLFLLMLHHLVACERKDFSRLIIHFFSICLIMLAFSAPLLVVQYLETKTVMRGQLDFNVGTGLRNLILPWPLASSEEVFTGPQFFAGTIYLGTLYFFGGVFAWAFLIMLPITTTQFAVKGRRALLSTQNRYAIVAIFLFVLALGARAGLWNFLAQFPPFDHFRMPIKLLPFLVLFVIVSSAIFLERLRSIKIISNSVFWIIAAGSITLTEYNAVHAQNSITLFPDRPYPKITPELEQFAAKDFSTKGRVFAISNERSPVPGYPLALGKNYATYYQVPNVLGQNGDSVDMNLPENLSALNIINKRLPIALNEYGVEWVLISKLPGEDRPVSDHFLSDMSKIAFRKQDFGVTEGFYIKSPNTKPIVYGKDNPHKAQEYFIRTDGLDIKLNDFAGGELVINFIYHDWFTAITDLNYSLNLYPDRMGRIVANVPPWAKTIQLRYNPPWSYGIIGGIFSLILALVLRKNERTAAEMIDKLIIIFKSPDQWNFQP